ncbi:MAG: hypothetical protein KF912_14350 [Phycisphaeraceae bacterium]|nr:hypothetical protein [Phycisphaeraceae bacterium]MBX3368485.1 hypothetical protein [Phycisphaeraceae bacterium]QYK47620.1 MAG: hypothetical protein KF838_12610 [Phycisphaeraceae bacterium]
MAVKPKPAAPAHTSTVHGKRPHLMQTGSTRRSRTRSPRRSLGPAPSASLTSLSAMHHTSRAVRASPTSSISNSLSRQPALRAIEIATRRDFDADIPASPNKFSARTTHPSNHVSLTERDAPEAHSADRIQPSP